MNEATIRWFGAKQLKRLVVVWTQPLAQQDLRRSARVKPSPNTIHVMLLLLQAVAQQLPPIHITVLQPSSPPGLPELAKILISAGVGAAFAIATSILMEFAKPAISKLLLRRSIKHHIVAELTLNLSHIQAGWLILKEAETGSEVEKDEALEAVASIARNVRTDRYDSNFENQKEIVYDFDWGSTLDAVYRHVTKFAEQSHTIAHFDYAQTMFKMGLDMGLVFFQNAGLHFAPLETTDYGYYRIRVEFRERQIEETDRGWP